MVKKLLLYICVLASLNSFHGCRYKLLQEPREQCELVRVIDGDTILVVCDQEEVKVRFIGIDAPESVHIDEAKNNNFGRMASEYTSELLNGVSFVYLEYDMEKYDDYERVLAYVYLDPGDDFTKSINNVLVKQGYAVHKEYLPNTKYSMELMESMELAEENKTGLWNETDIKSIW